MDETRNQIFGMDIAQARVNGATFFIPEYARHRPVARHMLRGSLFEPRLHKLVARYFASRPGSMLHAGTFFGDMLPSFSRKVTGQVYAFEPVLENYLLAWSVVETNGLDNVTLLHAGLGETAETARIGVATGERHRGGSSTFATGADENEEEISSQHVSVLTIDGMALPDLAMVQLDVEGWELPVLQGGRETLMRQRPLVVLEDNNADCAPFLKELDYEPLGHVARSNTAYCPREVTLPAEVLATIG